jgi:hypothetical protein
MKQVKKWRWRYRWAGRMVTGWLHCTADEVRALHLEADCVPSTRIVIVHPKGCDQGRARTAAPVTK